MDNTTATTGPDRSITLADIDAAAAAIDNYAEHCAAEWVKVADAMRKAGFDTDKGARMLVPAHVVGWLPTFAPKWVSVTPLLLPNVVLIQGANWECLTPDFATPMRGGDVTQTPWGSIGS